VPVAATATATALAVVVIVVVAPLVALGPVVRPAAGAVPENAHDGFSFRTSNGFGECRRRPSGVPLPGTSVQVAVTFQHSFRFTPTA
jgi:hypothetical protein